MKLHSRNKFFAYKYQYFDVFTGLNCAPFYGTQNKLSSVSSFNVKISGAFDEVCVTSFSFFVDLATILLAMNLALEDSVYIALT